MYLDVVILAAGMGTRMKSAVPKVLHPVGGEPLLVHVLKQVIAIKPNKIWVVVGHESERVQQCMSQYLKDQALDIHDLLGWVQQSQPLGTGDAVKACLPVLNSKGTTLILYADTPLIQATTLKRLLTGNNHLQLTLLTNDIENPVGLGRILRNNKNQIVGIVEEKDASIEQKELTETNTGVYVCPTQWLIDWLPKLRNDNAQKEYYLTDIVNFAVHDKKETHAIKLINSCETLGVNDRQQLAMVEKHYQRQRSDALMRQGVSFADPERVTIRGDVQVNQDVFIEANVLLEGPLSIGRCVYIGSNTCVRNSKIENNVVINHHCVIDGVYFGENCQIGPFARVRPNTELGKEVKLGNFVEVKSSKLGDGTKVNHLSYLGDSILGESVNVGAGTITCNYDGAHKFQTIIDDNVFIGSNSALVAPVHLQQGATVAAGSTITHEVPEKNLAVARSRQVNKSGWQRPTKK